MRREPISVTEGLPLQRRANRIIKRALDIALAAIALIVLSPLIAAIAVAALVLQGRPILFRQRRPGRFGVPFVLIKFRTMREPDPGEAEVGTDVLRVTRLGRFLRATSLDELPELWNVLRGEMSLVGPRPLLMGYLPCYTAEERRRHDLAPGITGWAVVHGRQQLGFLDRLELDLWYVDHQSLLLDLRIMGMTVVQVLRRRGAAEVQAIGEVDLPERFQPGLQASRDAVGRVA